MQRAYLPAVLALLAPLAGAVFAKDAALTLVSEGKPKCVLVTAASADVQEKRQIEVARAILADHLRQMSGAEVPVVAESVLGETKIEAGRLAPAPGRVPAGTEVFILVGEGELARRLGVTSEGLGTGGMRIATVGNALVLIGSFDGVAYTGGTVYAAVHFLERLGCRYLWPGETGKVVPKRATITIEPLDIRYTPPVGQRKIRFMPKGPRRFDEGLAALGLAPQDQAEAMKAAQSAVSSGAWGTWHFLGGSIGLKGGHAGGGLRGGWDEWGAKHPEWFALQADGTRDQSKAGGRFRLCVSNPGLIEHVANDIIERVPKEGLKTVSLSPNDGGYSSFCLCQNCKKLDPPDAPKVTLLIFEKVGESKRTEIEYPSLSDRYVHYWNAIAERVARVHPDLLFEVDAYSRYATPPVREKLHPNLVVRYVPSDLDGWKGWQAAGTKRIFWRPNVLHSGYQQGTLNYHKARQIVDTMRYMIANGMLATDVQGIYDNWATQGLNYYVAARTAWDPRPTYDEVLADYCRSGFGAAAEPVRKYFLRLEDLAGPTMTAFTPEIIVELRGLLNAARQAERDEAVRRRIAFVRTGLEFTALSAEVERLAAQVEEKGAVDKKAAADALEKRWNLMREMALRQPLAVNVALVAGHDRAASVLARAAGWRPPAADRPAPALGLDEAQWLYEDQSQTGRKAGGGNR